jgi:hypothetical protein
MIRKLLLPALAAVLLGGCVTGYDYRGGNGDYYYGQPSVDYYDGYYGGYGYPGWSGMMGFGYGYGGYGYGGYGYGYPYYGYGYPYYPPVIIVRPDRPSGRPGRPDLHPGDPSQTVPAPSFGPHNLTPSFSAPAMGEGRSVPQPRPRFDPAPYPHERIQRQPTRPMLREVRESPRPERDDGLKPKP